ncbi:MAG: hypothetical protein V4719_19275 [Planctomycetota bacterium]
MNELPSNLPSGETRPVRSSRRKFFLSIIIGFAVLVVGLVVSLIVVRSQNIARMERIRQVAAQHQFTLHLGTSFYLPPDYEPYLGWLRPYVADYFEEIQFISLDELTADLPPTFFDDLSHFHRIGSIHWLIPRHSKEIVGLLRHQQQLYACDFAPRNLQDEDLECISQSPYLHSLYMNGLESKDVKGRFLKAAAAAPLDTLTLHMVNLDDAGCQAIGRLKTLQHLDLSGCELNSESAKAFTGLSSVIYLTVDDTAVDDQFGATLGALPALEHLSVEGTLLTEQGLQHLEHCRVLSQLYTDGKRGGPELLAHLCHCVRLKSVDIVWSGKFSASEMANFNALPDLTYLYFSDIGDSEAAHLLQCKHLTRLDIHSSRMTSVGVGSLMQLPDLRHLKLAGKEWGPELVEVLYESPTLETVKILDREWEWWQFEDLREGLRAQSGLK